MKSKNTSYIDLLQLSRNEQIILNLLDNEHSTPVSLSKDCKIPRPTIYTILTKLGSRGLIIKKKESNKIFWQKRTSEEIEKAVFHLKNSLIPNTIAKQEKITITDSSQVIVHRGQKAILRLFSDLVDKHAGEKMIALQGNNSAHEWSKIFPVEDINIINRKIKKNMVITELITSREWFESQTKLFGVDWAKNFEGRTVRMQNIEDKYLNYSTQIFIFGKKVFIDSMVDEVFIEITNPEIAKLLISIANFVQDHSNVLDANELLRKLISKNTKIK